MSIPLPEQGVGPVHHGLGQESSTHRAAFALLLLLIFKGETGSFSRPRVSAGHKDWSLEDSRNIQAPLRVACQEREPLTSLTLAVSDIVGRHFFDVRFVAAADLVYFSGSPNHAQRVTKQKAHYTEWAWELVPEVHDRPAPVEVSTAQ